MVRLAGSGGTKLDNVSHQDPPRGHGGRYVRRDRIIRAIMFIAVLDEALITVDAFENEVSARGREDPVVEEVATVTGFDFDDPQIGIEPALAGKKLIDALVRHGAAVEHAHHRAVRLRFVETGRRGAEKERRPVEAIDADKDCAGIIVAMAHDDGGHAF
jgi:hypothetical protein